MASITDFQNDLPIFCKSLSLRNSYCVNNKV